MNTADQIGTDRGRDARLDMRLLRPREVIRDYGVPKALVYAALKNGTLRHIKSGRNCYIPVKAANDWFATLAGMNTTAA